jgi:hypothetical protein
MTISNKNFWPAAIFGLLIGGAFTAAAFTEPTTSPSSTTFGVPINVGADTQYVNSSLGIGDGTTQADSTKTSNNSLYVARNLLTDATVVRQNANFVGNVTVEGRNVFAGALRASQVSLSSNPASAPGYTNTDYRLYFPAGSTTNLLNGNYCTTAANTACPSGTAMVKYDDATSKATCRKINPVKSPGSIGNC